MWIPATICHEAASAFVRRIQRMNCSWASPSARRRTNPTRSFARCVAVPLQGGVEAVDQGFSGEGLGQETGRSRLQGSRASVLDGEGRDENERQPVALGEQVGLQLETA